MAYLHAVTASEDFTCLASFGRLLGRTDLSGYTINGAHFCVL